MGKYNANYSCGHSGEVTLYGKIDERFAILERMKTELCPECSDKLAEAKCIEVEGRYNLPALTGSEKQIKWARRIRSRVAEWCDANKLTPELAKAKPNLNKIFDLSIRKTSAAWWIDSRDLYPETIIRIAMKQVKEARNEP